MNTYPRDYIAWCFGTANNISDYAKDKQLELMEEQARIIELYSEHVDSLNRYINSSKFDVDTTVQVIDISLRLTELRLELLRGE